MRDFLSLTHDDESFKFPAKEILGSPIFSSVMSYQEVSTIPLHWTNNQILDTNMGSQLTLSEEPMLTVYFVA
jgi:hypothetical protein